MKLLSSLFVIGSCNAVNLRVTQTKCYVQGIDSLPVIQGIQYHGAEVNMSNCLGFCLRRGYFAFGVDARDLCLCGNQIDPNAQKVPKSDCNDTCKGDESQPCGGLRRVRAAEVVIDDSIRKRGPMGLMPTLVGTKTLHTEKGTPKIGLQEDASSIAC